MIRFDFTLLFVPERHKWQYNIIHASEGDKIL